MKRELRRPGAAALLVAAFSASAQVSPPDLEAPQQNSRGAAPSRPAGVTGQQRLLEEGEARLASGDAGGARQAFEKATQLVHAADVELSLVRAYMQAGEYRRALAFGAHAAGAHAEIPGGMALYAWLLHVGGQSRAAAARLAEAVGRAPDDLVLQETRANLSGPWPKASGLLAEGPWRAAPYAWGAVVPATARVLGSGVLIDGGRAALVPTQLLGEGQRVWVRNGLGQTTEASIEQRLDPIPLTLLRLAQQLAQPPPVQRSAREPFGGSPGYTLEYAPGAGDLAAWPLLRLGFFGSVPRDGGLRPLGIDVPPGPRGGPVFDAAGQLVGIAITDGAGLDRIVFASQLTAQIGASDPGASSSAPPPRMPVDEIYERALTAAAQIILAR